MTSTLQDRLLGTGTAGEAPRRRSTRALRPARTPAGVALATLLTVSLSLLAVELICALMGSPLGLLPLDELIELGGRHVWAELSVAGLVLAAIGMGMLLLAALPGRTRLAPLETADPLIVIGITRSGLRRSLRDVAQQVDGVTKARVQLRRRTIEVTVITREDCPGSLLRQVGTAVGDRLAALGALCGGEVVVRLRRRGI
ncbi:DUF6286 domain-containing protein [Nonomuraea soli]|uniref:DUF6286 domain-containing protein n=1 Tax=Nonomuraea soli TaxID=1032476 RepID=A0A7W0CL33_9ACTN|nr:DUF6286 domain-containing protein [Nonomuraea soli]MBA2893172.1 hypothetical protein [Nonomuraea soli]